MGTNKTPRNVHPVERIPMDVERIEVRRARRALFIAAMVCWLVGSGLLSQGVSFGMPRARFDDGSDLYDFVRLHAWLLILGGIGFFFVGGALLALIPIVRQLGRSATSLEDSEGRESA